MGNKELLEKRLISKLRWGGLGVREYAVNQAIEFELKSEPVVRALIKVATSGNLGCYERTRRKAFNYIKSLNLPDEPVVKGIGFFEWIGINIFRIRKSK